MSDEIFHIGLSYQFGSHSSICRPRSRRSNRVAAAMTDNAVSWLTPKLIKQDKPKPQATILIRQLKE